MTLSNVPSKNPLRKTVRVVAGQWQFVDSTEYYAHIKQFAETAERTTAQAHSSEFEVFAIFSGFRVLVACVDPLAISQGIQIFVPDAAISLVH